MAGFAKFEDINAWQKARKIAFLVYQITLVNQFSRDYDLRSQIRRSATSIMANIAEGQGRRSDKEFANFLNIALGSIAETKSHLYLALDLQYLKETEFRDLYTKLDEAGKMTMALVTYLRKNQQSS